MEHNDDRLFESDGREPEELLAVFEEPAPETCEPETAGQWLETKEEPEFFDLSAVEPQDIPIPEQETVFEPEPEPAPVMEQTETDQPEPQPRNISKKSRCRGRKILAAALSAALVIGSCAVTAGLINRKWESRMRNLSVQLDDLRAQIGKLEASQTGISVSGSPMASQGALTPSQVYAMNVESVVAISNQSTTNVWGQISETASSGTGFILTADGYILSNYHVVEGANRLTVMTYTGKEYEARLVGFDKINDVSILKVEAVDLKPVTIGSSDDLIVGDQVVAIGNPLGELTSSLTVGYISAKDRTINTDGSLINMMQTDAAINPGNSGGPLFNMKGEVVGITTAKYSGSTGSGASIEGIGFAIPIADVMAMTEDLIVHGYLTRQAYLGVSVTDLDSTTAAVYSLPMGSYVQSVVAGSCAEKAGIMPKDIIIKVGKFEVDGNSTLQNVLRKFNAGDTTTVTVYRAGAELELPITFDERPQDADSSQQQQSQSQGEMPSSGSYEDWYNYFYPFFGGQP